MTEIGGYRIDPVLDGQGPRSRSDFFPETTEQQWERHGWVLDRTGHLTVAIGGFLVRGHDRTALVDLGHGPGSITGITTGRFLESLGELGVQPPDVTDVLFTHLHADHVGWASVDGVPQFPDATFWCGADDYQHFVVDRRDRFADERLRPCDNPFQTYEQCAPLPEISTTPAPGHTPGSTVIILSAGAERVILLGDVVHSPVQLLEPDWSTPYDLDPHLARRTRIRLLSDFEGHGGALMTAGHFPGLRFGRLFLAHGRRRWVV